MTTSSTATSEWTEAPARATEGVVLAHPTGNQFFRHLAAGLRDVGRLAGTFTCVDWPGGRWFNRILPRSISAELSRRSFSSELRVPVADHPWREAARLAAGRLGWRALTRHETGIFSVDAVYHNFDRWVAGQLADIPDGRVAYAYEDAADATFVEARRLGWLCAYDLPIAYWETSRRLLDEEAERWPAWEQTLGGTRDSPGKCERKRRELAAADVVICPSTFVADSIPNWACLGKRLVVAPFGSPEGGGRRAEGGGQRSEVGGQRAPVRRALLASSFAQPTEDRQGSASPKRSEGDSKMVDRRSNSNLRVLFAGSMTQRKGLADLFAAMRLLRRSDVELVVMGSPIAAMEFYRGEFPDFTYKPTRPHAAVLELMLSCDVLVLPSIVEGRALVMQEAMSQGLPIIITPNTGGADLVDEGRTGFLVPMRAPDAIAEKLAWCADNREAVAEMGRVARVKAATYTWDAYGRKIADAI